MVESFDFSRLKISFLIRNLSALPDLSETGKTITLDPKTSIVVPQERAGLHAIDVLDPDLVWLISSCFG